MNSEKMSCAQSRLRRNPGKLINSEKMSCAESRQRLSGKEINSEKMSRAESRQRLSQKEIKEIFKGHDLDGDGQLSFGELLLAFGILGSTLIFYAVESGMAHADADGNGFIDEHELDKLVDYANKFQRLKH